MSGEQESVRGALLAVDQIGNLEVQGQVRFEVLRVAGLHCFRSI